MSDTWVENRPERPREVATYDYHDAAGNFVCRKHRYTPKQFKFSRPDPVVPRKLTWNLEGIQVPLYRLPTLLSRPDEPVYLVEGEKDAELLLTAGLVATTAPFGSRAPWQPQWLEPLKGRDVVALPDADADGETYVANFATAANGHVKSLRVLHLPGLEPETGADTWDWFTHYEGNADWLSQLAIMAPKWTRPLESQEEVSGVQLMAMNFPFVEWTAEGIVPTRSLSIWGGRPKVGKSSLLLWLAKSICGGSKFLNVATKQGHVLLICLEDSPRRLKNRMEAQGWTPEEVANLTLRFNFPQYHDGGAAKLETLAKKEYALIGIDTLGRFAPRLDLMDYQMVSTTLAHLSLIADRNAVPIIFPHHTRKGQPGVLATPDPVADLLGSTALAGSADVVGVLYRDRSKAYATFALTGRDIEERDINVVGTPGNYTWETTQVIPGIDRDSLKARVLTAIKYLGGRVRAVELEVHLNVKHGSLTDALVALVVAGALTRKSSRAPYELAEEEPNDLSPLP